MRLETDQEDGTNTRSKIAERINDRSRADNTPPGEKFSGMTVANIV